jgi:WhiB family transcriptional regulator, redox-sensing transcriptional regulator
MGSYPTRKCVVCGQGYFPTSGRQKTCGRACGRKLANAARRLPAAVVREPKQLSPQAYLADGLAACKDKDPDLFFPLPGERSTEAKAICRACELFQPCRAWALAQPWRLLHGIYGATSFEDRRRYAGGGVK